MRALPVATTAQRFLRIGGVAAGITAASIATGAVAGIGCMLCLEARDKFNLFELDLLFYAAWIGAVYGLMLGPVAVLGFMRHVPLGRLFGEMCVATIITGTIGFMSLDGFFPALNLASAGFLAAGARLEIQYRKRERFEIDSTPRVRNV